MVARAKSFSVNNYKDLFIGFFLASLWVPYFFFIVFSEKDITGRSILALVVLGFGVLIFGGSYFLVRKIINLC